MKNWRTKPRRKRRGRVRRQKRHRGVTKPNDEGRGTNGSRKGREGRKGNWAARNPTAVDQFSKSNLPIGKGKSNPSLALPSLVSPEERERRRCTVRYECEREIRNHHSSESYGGQASALPRLNATPVGPRTKLGGG